MDALETISKLWPLAVSFVTLVIVLAKMDGKISILEQKVATLFDLHNKMVDKQVSAKKD